MEIRYGNQGWVRPPRAERRLRRRYLRAAQGGLLREYAADALTLTRILLAAGLILVALVERQANLGRDIWLLVLAWTTDMLDGNLARRFGTVKRSWLGSADVYIDMFVALALMVYMLATGLVSLPLAVGYLLVWGIVFWRFGFPALLAQVFQNPIYAGFLVLTALHAPQVLPWLGLFTAVGLLLFWRRLAQLLGNVWQSITRRATQV